jgi:electron transfer flavoprotein alpha subunit
MRMNQDIFVAIEHLRGQISDISYVMLAAGRELARGTGGSVVGVLLGHQVESLADGLDADSVYYFDHPTLAEFISETYQHTFTSLIEDRKPRAVLFGNTSIGADVASTLSARLGLPLVSACLRVLSENGSQKFTSQICGGKIFAEGALPDATVLMTMVPGGYKPEAGRTTGKPQVIPLPIPELENLRVVLHQYIEPEVEDVDIAKEPIIVSVGRGISNQDNIELVEELAAALGGVVGASRPVVDQGWLPGTRLIGKSGKSVKPKLNIALGISGAPEHVEAITGGEVIIAINTDPDAPIFNVAKYGAIVDLLDLAPILAEKINEIRSG